MSADPTEFRQESRRRWARSAPGWRRRREAMHQMTMPVTAWMVDAVRLQPGHTVLELAAGLGDTGFLAAELIRPGGTLICSDFVPEMLTAAQESAAERGIDNVRFKQIDAESIDLPAAGVDAVLCRWGYMLMADPEAALRETRRVLKPGGRAALAAWAGPDDNPWASVPAREMIRRDLLKPPDPASPGQFAWAAEGVIGGYLEGAGFVDFQVEALDFVLRYPGFDAWWDTSLDIGRDFSDAVQALDEPTREEVRAALRERSREFDVGGGELVLPARTWVAVAVG